MKQCIALIAFSMPLSLFAQGTTPKPKAAEYPVHARIGNAGIGVEYMVRSFGADQMLLADDYLIVEVAIYPDKLTEIAIDARKFMLRLNGKKGVLLPESAGTVAASLKYPDWQRNKQVIVGGGIGDRGVILGQPGSVGRFPGDRRAESRLPAPPRAPADNSPVEKEPVDITELVQRVALPEGLVRNPVSGFIFFPYRGKLNKLKSVELLVHLGSEPSSEPMVLRLK